MKLQFNWVIVLLLLMALGATSWTALGQKQVTMATQWEYTVKHSESVGRAPVIFNELGAQGWELVSVGQDG